MRFWRWDRGRMSWTGFAMLFAASLLHFASYDFRNQPLFTDISYYLYYGAQTAQGAIPYVDYFEIKTPGVIFMGMWLQQLGSALGVDPLYSVRVGYLLLAAITASVMGVICLRLCRNRVEAAWIGTLTYCGFNLLGILPAIGNSPKMVSIAATSAAMLLVYHRRWFWAGVLAGVASLDWQVSGALTFAAVVVAGLSCPQKLRNCVSIILGTFVSWVPSIIYFAVKGALGTYLYMVTFGAFTKASSEEMPFLQRMRTIFNTAELQCAGEMWLIAVAIVGIALFCVRRSRRPAPDSNHFLWAIAVYHFGIILFSLVDFQARIDLFILLATLVPFAALALCQFYEHLKYRLLRHFKRRRFALRLVLRVVAAIALIAMMRPSFLRGGWRIDKEVRGQEQATLMDQKEVARLFFDVVGAGRIAVVRWQELLFLGRGTNAMPFVSWNLGTWSHYRQGSEDWLETLSRLLEPEDLDIIVLSWNWLPYLHQIPLGSWVLERYQPMYLESKTSQYGIIFFRRADLPPCDVPGVRYLAPGFFRNMLTATTEDGDEE